ncbi:MAG: Arm DNA-binding domain-containing protein [Hyphomicrobiales bacterium]
MQFRSNPTKKVLIKSFFNLGLTEQRSGDATIRKNITTKTLDGRPSKKGAELQDLLLKGFGCRHTGEARANFFIRYRDETGKQRRLAIGKYPATSLKEARKLTKKLLKAAAKGKDVRGSQCHEMSRRQNRSVYRQAG